MIKLLKFKKSKNFIGLSLMSRIAGFGIFIASNLNRNLSSKLQLAGDVANYSDWLRLNFGNPKRFFNRERLFGYLLDFEVVDDLEVYEFGVAKGYLTQWRLERDA